MAQQQEQQQQQQQQQHENGVISYPVPDGFPAMSMPVRPEQRLTASDIELGFWTEADAMRIAEINYDGFPMIWWNKHEDETVPMPERVRRLARRCFAPVPGQQDMHGLKATLKSTGQIVGMAVWYANVHAGIAPTSYPTMPGLTFPSSFLLMVYQSCYADSFGWAARMGWTPAERAELWSHVRPSMDAEIAGYDSARLAEMGDQQHWYLGPLCVDSAFRGRGIGKLLLQWGIDMAEAMQPPVPVLLDAFPNARPVYYHLGFVETGAAGGEDQLVRWPRRREE